MTEEERFRRQREREDIDRQAREYAERQMRAAAAREEPHRVRHDFDLGED